MISYCYFATNYLVLNFIFFVLQIGETIADKISGKPLPAIKVEEPTVKMSFSINVSPFVGREVSYVFFKPSKLL